VRETVNKKAKETKAEETMREKNQFSYFRRTEDLIMMHSITH